MENFIPPVQPQNAPPPVLVPVFGHIMVDLETLGTTPGSVILSAALVEFNPYNGAIGRQYYTNIDLRDSMKQGFRVDPGTLMWWMQQEKEAQNKAFSYKDVISCSQFLLNVQNFVNACVSNTNGAPPQLWSNSASFDLAMIRSYYGRTSTETPWKYTLEMCVRTLCNMVPEVRNIPFQGTKHDPIADCLHQIKQVHAAYTKLKIGGI
jgi:hypothetical protein